MIPLPALPWLKIVKYGAVILLCVLIGSQMQLRFSERPAIKRLEAQLLTAQHDLGVCHAGQVALQSALDAQNAAVAEMEARTVALQEAQASALQEAETRASDARARLAAARAAMTGEDACEAAGTMGAQFLWGGVK